MAISAVGEGCHKYMEEVLTQIVEAILPYLADQVSVLLFSPRWKMTKRYVQLFVAIEDKFIFIYTSDLLLHTQHQ